jgi:hexosaminidase
MSDIAIVPAPRELTVHDGRWVTADPLGEAVRDVVENLDAAEYRIEITGEGARLTAGSEDALRHAETTYAQLVEAAEPAGGGQVAVPLAHVADAPRFGWRGMMLDVARHFRPVRDVKRFVDLLALYKLNRLHLHLSDDQGWRIAIAKWPRLATHGGSTEVGGGKGGHYTQRQYSDLVRYAAERYVQIVPEIDMPGHVHAALSSYPKLSCDGKPTPLFTGIDVGFSSLCVAKPVVYDFVSDVIGELARLTPGPFIHIGGDEAAATKPSQYVAFVRRVQQIVRSYGKRMIGWDEIARVRLDPSTVVQHWNPPDRPTRTAQAAARGSKVIMSPAEHAYLDMKYDASTPIGLTWAGYTSVRDAYVWDPTREVPGVGASAVLGVEAPLWSETIRSLADAEYLAFPRLIGIGEIGWSPARGPSWAEYRVRLGAQGPLLRSLGVNYYRSPEVPWK